MTTQFGAYTIGESMPVQTARGSYSYTIAKPAEGSVDRRPVVLMAVEDPSRMSLCNAMEDVSSVIMKREKWAKDDKAIWIETAESDPSLGQVVTRPTTMPAWGPEQDVKTMLAGFQTPAVAAPSESPSLG